MNRQAPVDRQIQPVQQAEYRVDSVKEKRFFPRPCLPADTRQREKGAKTFQIEI